MIPSNNKIGVIFNARDFVGSDSERKQKHFEDETSTLNELGFEAEPLDLKDYFGKTDLLKSKLEFLGSVWVCGGNTLVLRQAMFLSGFDVLFEELKKREDFLWAGYSAGICILSPDLKAIDQVDDPQNFPYENCKEVIWSGLNYFNHYFMPHYDSDHPESEDIGKEVQRCIDNKWLFKALRDGEVVVID